MFKKKKEVPENSYDRQMRECIEWVSELSFRVHKRVDKICSLIKLQKVFAENTPMWKKASELLLEEQLGLENCCAERDEALCDVRRYYRENIENFTHDWAVSSIPDSFEIIKNQF